MGSRCAAARQWIRSLPLRVTIAAVGGRFITPVGSTGFKYRRDHAERHMRLVHCPASTGVSSGGTAAE